VIVLCLRHFFRFWASSKPCVYKPSPEGVGPFFLTRGRQTPWRFASFSRGKNLLAPRFLLCENLFALSPRLFGSTGVSLRAAADCPTWRLRAVSAFCLLNEAMGLNLLFFLRFFSSAFLIAFKTFLFSAQGKLRRRVIERFPFP